jgi:cyclic pyranopterin phosphate synthase
MLLHPPHRIAMPSPELRDGHGRLIRYIRVSVTDKCNFRCLYCMPPEGLEWLPKAELLTYEEIASIVGELAALGVHSVRLTGGEPTIRPQLETLIELIAAIDGIDDISLSTNGLLFVERAKSYASAGLKRVNISSDSLRLERIRAIARRAISFDPIAAALAAERAGLDPVKINMVVMRGINDDEIRDFAQLTLDHPWHVRFIELMPVGDMRDLTWEHVVPSSEVLEKASAIAPLNPDVGPARGSGPARYYRFAGAPGSIGVITPMTHTYCDSCNRVRLTVDGRLRTCLFGNHEVSLRDPLRRGERVTPFVLAALADKPRAHELLDLRVGGLLALSQVGG